MKQRLVVILAIVVAIPLGCLTWLSLRLQAAEERSVEQQYREWLSSRLEYPRQSIDTFMEAAARNLDQSLEQYEPADPAAREQFLREHPFIRRVFKVSPDARMLYPNPNQLRATEQGQRFYTHISDLVVEHEHLFDEPIKVQQTAAPVQKNIAPAETKLLTREQSAESSSEELFGWSPWYAGPGMELLFWQKSSDGGIIGAEIDRTRLMMEIIGLLPQTRVHAESRGSLSEQTRVQLVDEKNRILYQWGLYSPDEGTHPDSSLPLAAPLSAWTFQLYVPSQAVVFGSGERLAVWSALVLAGAALIMMAIYLFLLLTRQMREAEKRVNFVNQVSHELKTPLTNIRMYAELMDEEVGKCGFEGKRHLDIIISESRRLSRLIENVLSFSRDERNALKLRMRRAIIDEILAETAEQFRPALEQKDIELDLKFSAPRAVLCDPDAVGQIIGNLIGNVEKYAAEGKYLGLETSQTENETVVLISDRGEGVSAGVREKIFEPFYRADNSITSIAVGTGIGLTIARKLARMHGGDLRIVDCEQGCVFELTIRNGHFSRDEKST